MNGGTVEISIRINGMKLIDLLTKPINGVIEFIGGLDYSLPAADPDVAGSSGSNADASLTRTEQAEPGFWTAPGEDNASDSNGQSDEGRPIERA